MMKLLLCVVVISAACVLAMGAASPTICSVISCSAAGQSCLEGNSSVPKYAEPHCNDGLYCNSSSSTCLAQLTLGSTCDPGSTEMCADGLHCDYFHHNCTAVTTYVETIKYGGEACNAANGDVCQYDVGGYTTSNLCPDTNRCPGNITGGTCDLFEDYYRVCNKGLYCNSARLCAAQLANGGACLLGTWCTSGFCRPINATSYGVCANKYSGNVNDYCGGGNDCGTDLFCNLTLGQFIGQCQKVRPSSYKACSSQDDCASYEYCSCKFDGTSSCVTGDKAYQTSTSAAYDSCATAAGCAADDNDCGFAKCPTQFCASLQEKFGRSWSDQGIGSLACYYSSTDVANYNKCKQQAATTTSAAVTVAAPVLLIAAVAAAALF